MSLQLGRTTFFEAHSTADHQDREKSRDLC